MSHSVESFAVMRTKLENDIMKLISSPFYLDEDYQRDAENTLEIPDATFRANGKFYVFYDTTLMPGLTFRGLKANTGDLNILTPEVTIEVNIPEISGHFYVISGNPGEKPVVSRGSFELNYETAIANGTFTFFIEEYYLYVTNSVIDFQRSKNPKVTFYDQHGDEMTINDLSVEEKGSMMPDILWPCVTSMIYPMLREEICQIAHAVRWHKISPNLPYHEAPLQQRSSKFLKEIVGRMKFRETDVKDGKIKMPDFETMFVHENDENIWGTFSASSGFLGNLTDVYLTEYYPLVHMKSENELEFSGMIRIGGLDGLMHCYDKYTIKSTCQTAEGQIESVLVSREAFVKITMKRINGESIKEGRIEFINGSVRSEITGLGEFDWLERHINAWISGELRAKGIPALKKTLENCLNQALEEFDVFAYWQATTPDTDGSEYYTRGPA